MRGHAGSALKALISSKVNQWTLLVGTIPLVFAISGGVVKPFVLDNFQQHELFLTAAQSLFGVAVLVNLRLSRSDGLILFVLFASQLIVEKIRMEVAVVYILLAVIFHFKHWRCLIPAARIGLGMKRK
jgi:cation:H+ antiporter